MAKLQKCTVGARHKWVFVKNVEVQSMSFHSIHIALRGKYRCECGLVKYEGANPNGNSDS